jgi:hypothetical protein
MRNPGNDFHRRDADALKCAELIRGEAQAKLNAAEWMRRAVVVAKGGDSVMGFRLVEQAGLELRPYRH